MILLLDNRDSFTFNLVQALQGLGAEVRVVRADRTPPGTVLRERPRAVLIGPGPGRPEEARTSLAVLRALAGRVPVLGVCLGHQALAVAWGGRVRRARTLVHGATVPVEHDGRGVFQGLPSPLAMTRYNSLAVDEACLPACLEVSARDPEGEVMALRHRTLAVEGVQFHPESVLSAGGRGLLANFARQAEAAPREPVA